MKGHRSQTDCKAEDIGNQMEIDFCNGGIDLEIEASLLCHFDSAEGAFKDPFTLRKASWVSGFGPSRLILIR